MNAIAASILLPLAQQYVIPVITPILLGFGTWTLAKIGGFFHYKIKDQQAAVLEKAMTNGINLALNTAASNLSLNGKAAQAATYVTQRVPDTMKKLGLEPSDIVQLVTARMPYIPAIPAPPGDASPRSIAG